MSFGSALVSSGVPDLSSFVYVSEAARPLAEADRGAILIFECLAGPRGRFVRWLEGPKAAVASVFEERIVPASQHARVEVTHTGSLDARVFPDWSMSYVRAADAALGALAKVVRRTS